MSHAWVGIPDLIQEEFEDNLVEEARKVAVLEARDLAVAKAVRNACLDEADLFEDEAELIRNLDLVEIIKGVK